MNPANCSRTNDFIDSELTNHAHIGCSCILHMLGVPILIHILGVHTFMHRLDAIYSGIY